MLKSLAGLAFLVASTGAGAAGTSTNFAVRTVPQAAPASHAAPVAQPSLRPVRAGSAINLRAAASLGSEWGTVTSTYRSRARNRAVGGVRNSFHLSGRAIDIARRPGVTHAQIAAAFRNAGYHLIESLDEGDHSHFAFGSGGPARRALTRMQAPVREAGNATQWRMVTVASAILK